MTGEQVRERSERDRKGRSPVSELRELLVPHAPTLISKAVELALGGNEAALRICIRLLPALKSEALPVTLESIGGRLSEQGAGILRAAGEGEISPDQAATLMQALARQTHIVEVDELEAPHGAGGEDKIKSPNLLKRGSPDRLS